MKIPNDFTRCGSDGCCMVDKCLRRTSSTSYAQSYALFEPEKGQDCYGLILAPDDAMTALVALSEELGLYDVDDTDGPGDKYQFLYWY